MVQFAPQNALQSIIEGCKKLYMKLRAYPSARGPRGLVGMAGAAVEEEMESWIDCEGHVVLSSENVQRSTTAFSCRRGSLGERRRETNCCTAISYSSDAYSLIVCLAMLYL